MPYWMSKTAEMVAMDRWFSRADAGSEAALVTRYKNAHNRVASDPAVFRSASASLGRLPATAQPNDSFSHFNRDWVNLANPNSGGDYWPQIPTWTILMWLRSGISNAVQKALGTNNLLPGVAANDLFRYEIQADSTLDLTTVLPLCTTWVCTSPAGSSGFQADAMRGPSVVELIIATPQPVEKSHLWDFIRARIDAVWNELHPEVHLEPLDVPLFDVED
jgi:hypothetical protein